jgi:hypothetical protein
LDGSPFLSAIGPGSTDVRTAWHGVRLRARQRDPHPLPATDPVARLLISDRGDIFNIGADLGGTADAMQMMSSIHAYYWTPIFAALIIALLMWTSYNIMARVFKWLTLVLFTYVIPRASPLARSGPSDLYSPISNGRKTILPCWLESSEPRSRHISFFGKLPKR